MMKEDPLERLDRLAAEKKAKKGPNIILVIALAAVAVALGIALFVTNNRNKSLVGELNQEKAELASQVEALQADYSELSTNYESISHQLDSSREEINLLVEKVKKARATDRAEIRKYQKELGTLRAIMRSYVVQIDSLNTLNKKLTAENAAVRKESEERRQANEKLSAKVDELSGQVKKGAAVKARGISLAGLNGSGKSTDRSSRVVRFIANVTLVENDLAERGPVRVYAVVKDPDGNIVTNASSVSATVGGQSITASASREVDYQGAEVEMVIYINDISCVKGIYTLEVYSSRGRIGSAEAMFR